MTQIKLHNMVLPIFEFLLFPYFDVKYHQSSIMFTYVDLLLLLNRFAEDEIHDSQFVSIQIFRHAFIKTFKWILL